jgi:BMFP domain-containing protein YqiC
MLLAAFEIADQRARARIRSLEERVAALEAERRGGGVPARIPQVTAHPQQPCTGGFP